MPKHAFRFALVISLFAASFVSYRPAVSAPPAAPPNPSGRLQALMAQAGGDLRVGYHRGTGQVNFIGGSQAAPVYLAPATGAAVSAQAAAQQFLAEYGSLFGLTDPAQELTVKRERALADGRATLRYQQQFQGVPVFGGELMVGLDAAGNVLSAGGEVLPGLNMATQPTLAAAAAQQIAVAETASLYGVPAANLQASAPELWLYNPVLLRPERGGPTRLVWRMEVAPAGLSDLRELVLVDAASGQVALHFNQIDTAMNRMTYTASNGTTLPGTLLCNQGQTACGSDAHAVAAHLHAGQTYDYYLNVHGRDSIDGAGLTLTSTVHYDVNYFNAFWSGEQMVYGDAASFPQADDVVSHELTHGVTQYESGLFYYYQSGAINESFSDIWGEILDQTNGTGDDTAGVKWLLGEDVSPGGAIRDMEDPTSMNDPDKMTSANYYLGDGDYPNNDNGGVHFNSGVNNKAAFLMSDGGTFNSITVSALGITKTAKLYYEVQTNLLTSGSDYLDLYNALNQACINLTPAVMTVGDCVEVQDATNAVEMNLQPIASYNTEAALCPTGSPVSSLFASDVEGSVASFSTGALSGSNRWSLFTGYAHSGASSFIGNDFPGSISDSFLALDPSLGSLPANAYLHFYQAYGFHQGLSVFRDGGVLEYSTNGGGSWTDAGGLIQVNGYDGTLSNSFSNPLVGRSAFAGDSHGYISTRVNLSSLAGQTVRFRWRMGTDSSGADYGWWVDDISLHTCTGVAVASKVYLPFISRVDAPPASWTNIVTEGFEGTFPTGLWSVTDPGFEQFFWAKRNCRAHTGSFSAWAMGGGSVGSGLGCGANYIDEAFAWMIYGPFDLTGATAAELNYQLWANTESGWDFVYTLASLNGNNFYGLGGSGTTSGSWVPEGLNLASVDTLGSVLGQSNVWIAILFESDELFNFAEGAHVDEIVLRKCLIVSCPAADITASERPGSQWVETPAAFTLEAPPTGER